MTIALCLVLAAAGIVSGQGRQFRSAAEARAWLESEQLGTDPESLLIHLSFDAPRSVEVIRAYVALGLPLDRPARPGGLSPLTLVTRSCVGNVSAAETTAVLIQAGANPNVPAPDGDKSTPLMEAVACPAVLKQRGAPCHGQQGRAGGPQAAAGQVERGLGTKRHVTSWVCADVRADGSTSSSRRGGRGGPHAQLDAVGHHYSGRGSGRNG